MPMVEKTGLPDYDYMRNHEGYDLYFGKKIVATTLANDLSGEGAYIEYDKENDKGVITCAGRIETIEQSVFYDVDNLKTVILPKHVRTIMTTAFANIPTLESVTLPQNLKTIDRGAFAGNNSALKTVFCDIATPPTGSSGMFDATFAGTIYVPLGSVSLYQSADYWKKCNIQGYEF
jgi:hypothetical protein